jgi:hypothetical protein
MMGTHGVKMATAFMWSLLASWVAAEALSAESCTAASLVRPGWYIQSFEYAKSRVPTSGDLSMRLLNRATNVSTELKCSAGPDWNKCSSTKVEVSIKLNESTAHLMVNEGWTCRDKALAKP